MAKRKTKAEHPDHWAEYFAIQLTDEQKAGARAEMQKKVDAAKAAGVYERLLALEGKVHLDLNIDELREDRD